MLGQTWTLMTVLAVAVVAAGFATSTATAQPWGQLSGMHAYEATFDLGEGREASTYRATLLASSAPGNVFHDGQTPRFTFQIENLTDERLRVRGKVELIRYAQRYRQGRQWWPELHKLEDAGVVPITIDLPAKGWTNVTIEPEIPATRGGYALVVDLDEHGRRYLTSLVRTFEPRLERIQHPKQSLEHMPPEILARLGVQAVRFGVSYEADLQQREVHSQTYRQWLEAKLRRYHANKVTMVVEIGAGQTYDQPLGRGRPHLDDEGVMRDTKQDLVWLPGHDDDYEQFVYWLASEYGWPNGPITGFMLWNEPWEGISISGWGADMLRYRELYRRMGDAVFRAREEAGVDVLLGAADSSSNTWDKLFGEGLENSPFWPAYLDFCSIHYQGMSAPTLHQAWNEREHHKGRVLIWDTESWVANTDDRFVGVVAANRAAGYDRSMGTLSRIAVSVLSHRRIAYDTIRTPEGEQRIERLIETRPLAATYAAVQHFIGEREFDRVLFQTGLPWVFTFHGLNGNPDDGTVVVLGDIESLFNRELLFTGVRSLAEIEAKQPLRDELVRLNADDTGRRAELLAKLREREPFRDVTLTLENPDALFTLFDQYGNVMQAGESITIPLNSVGLFLRADPQRPGSFEKLLDAIRQARIDGLQPIEIVAYDMTEPIDRQPTFRLRLTNQLNEPVTGPLDIRLGSLELAHPEQLSFDAREQKWVDVQVVAGEARGDNTYPLAVTFDAGSHGPAQHHEDIRVNWIARRTITIDGNLDEWQDVPPQIINAAGSGGPSFTEQMWLPFETFADDARKGLASLYLAYDEDYFYFAARIVDDNPAPAPLRFATRDDDQYFYPELSYERKDDGTLIEHRWPEGVRRFSYRTNPHLPSSDRRRPFDNVLIGFNVLDPGDDGWLSHLPGRMPRFVGYKTTDYQYALNAIADEAGGGVEVYRLEAPGMPRKHFYPRQPEHPQQGAVEQAKLVVQYRDGMRIVEAAIPWAELPHVRERMEAGDPVKFSARVNHGDGGPTMELATLRSAAEGISNAFHPDWQQSHPNELRFGWER